MSVDLRAADGEWQGWAAGCSFDHAEAARSRRARVFLVTTGTLATAQLPFWLNWLSVNRPHYDLTVGMTDSARRFVSPAALCALTGSPVTANTWDGPGRDELRPVHNEIAIGYDAILVYPASVAFISALASGSGATPFTLALLGASVPVVIAPSFPPGVARNAIVGEVLARAHP